MADNDKQSDFITRTRQAAAQYQALIEQLRALDNEWGALYNSILSEDDFMGSNLAVIPSGDPATRLTSLTTAISNFESIISAYDAGVDTNLERIS